MARIVMKPRWKQLHHLKQKPYIHFNLETFGSKYMIPSDFRNSFHLLPEDKYINQTGAITRSRKYANIVVDVSNNYEYEVKLTNNTIFKQTVDDNRGIERKFELINPHHLQQPWILDFITQVSALSVMNHNYQKDGKQIKSVDVHLHQVRQITHYNHEAHNSPEGIHRDGCDYIVSAFVLSRENVIGGESIIYNENKELQYKTILNNQEGIYQEDRQQWHYVTPINIHKDKIGFRDLLGIDILLQT
jgi:hypothetical protein